MVNLPGITRLVCAVGLEIQAFLTSELLLLLAVSQWGPLGIFLEQDVSSLCWAGLYTTQYPQPCSLSGSGHQSLGSSTIATQIPWGLVFRLFSAQHPLAGRILSAGHREGASGPLWMLVSKGT